MGMMMMMIIIIIIPIPISISILFLTPMAMTACLNGSMDECIQRRCCPPLFRLAWQTGAPQALIAVAAVALCNRMQWDGMGWDCTFVHTGGVGGRQGEGERDCCAAADRRGNDDDDDDDGISAYSHGWRGGWMNR